MEVGQGFTGSPSKVFPHSSAKVVPSVPFMIVKGVSEAFYVRFPWDVEGCNGRSHGCRKAPHRVTPFLKKRPEILLKG